MGCKECNKDSSREDKCDRTRQELLDDDSRGEEGKSRRLTDINGLCSGNYGCGHAIEAHTNGTTEPQDITTRELLEELRSVVKVSQEELRSVVKVSQEELRSVVKVSQEESNERTKATLARFLDTTVYTRTSEVNVNHGIALDSREVPLSNMFLDAEAEQAILGRLNMKFGQLRERLKNIRTSTRGLREVVAEDADEQSVQSHQRKFLADLGHLLGLLVVKEVAVSTEYEFEGKKKGTYGAVDQVLISAQLKVSMASEKPYLFPDASSNFPQEQRRYTPPFPVLLAWESKSRERARAYMKQVRQRGRAKGKGKDKGKGKGEGKGEGKGQSSAPGQQHRDTAPGGTPGKTRPDKTLQRDDLVHAGFYAKGLRERNHFLYSREEGRLTASDEDKVRFLPVVISDSYTFVFEKRFLDYQDKSPQVNMDTHADAITKMLLWALHYASELEKVYHPSRQQRDLAAVSNKENPSTTLTRRRRQKRALTGSALLPLARHPYSPGQKIDLYLAIADVS